MYKTLLVEFGVNIELGLYAEPETNKILFFYLFKRISL